MRDGMRHYISPDELDVVRRFVDNWEDLCDADHAILASLVKRFDADVALQGSDEIRSIRRKAMEDLATDDLSVDDDAEVLKVEHGYWVQSWAWMPNE
jgi:hypothetical protein